MTDLHQPVDPPKPELEIRFLRLGCGDDIITYCLRLHTDSDGIDGWFLSEPVVVILEIDPDEQKQTCIMMPWLPRGIVTSNECIIEKDEVIVVMKVEADVQDYYKRLCREVFPQKPKLTNTKFKKEEKNVFGFDMKKLRPVKGIQNEKQEETPKANT